MADKLNLEGSELQRAYNIYQGDLSFYKDRLKEHYKNVSFCEKKIAEIEFMLDKCLEKAKEYGVKLEKL